MKELKICISFHVLAVCFLLLPSFLAKRNIGGINGAIKAQLFKIQHSGMNSNHHFLQRNQQASAKTLLNVQAQRNRINPKEVKADELLVSIYAKSSLKNDWIFVKDKIFNETFSQSFQFANKPQLNHLFFTELIGSSKGTPKFHKEMLLATPELFVIEPRLLELGYLVLASTNNTLYSHNDANNNLYYPPPVMKIEYPPKTGKSKIQQMKSYFQFQLLQLQLQQQQGQQALQQAAAAAANTAHNTNKVHNIVTTRKIHEFVSLANNNQLNNNNHLGPSETEQQQTTEKTVEKTASTPAEYPWLAKLFSADKHHHPSGSLDSLLSSSLSTLCQQVEDFVGSQLIHLPSSPSSSTSSTPPNKLYQHVCLSCDGSALSLSSSSQDGGGRVMVMSLGIFITAFQARQDHLLPAVEKGPKEGLSRTKQKELQAIYRKKQLLEVTKSDKNNSKKQNRKTMNYQAKYAQLNRQLGKKVDGSRVEDADIEGIEAEGEVETVAAEEVEMVVSATKKISKRIEIVDYPRFTNLNNEDQGRRSRSHIAFTLPPFLWLDSNHEASSSLGSSQGSLGGSSQGSLGSLASSSQGSCLQAEYLSTTIALLISQMIQACYDHHQGQGQGKLASIHLWTDSKTVYKQWQRLREDMDSTDTKGGKKQPQLMKGGKSGNGNRKGVTTSIARGGGSSRSSSSRSNGMGEALSVKELMMAQAGYDDEENEEEDVEEDTEEEGAQAAAEQEEDEQDEDDLDEEVNNGSKGKRVKAKVDKTASLLDRLDHLIASTQQSFAATTTPSSSPLPSSSPSRPAVSNPSSFSIKRPFYPLYTPSELFFDYASHILQQQQQQLPAEAASPSLVDLRWMRAHPERSDPTVTKWSLPDYCSYYADRLASNLAFQQLTIAAGGKAAATLTIIDETEEQKELTRLVSQRQAGFELMIENNNLQATSSSSADSSKAARQPVDGKKSDKLEVWQLIQALLLLSSSSKLAVRQSSAR